MVPLNSCFRLTLKMPTLSVQVVTSLHAGVPMSLSPLPLEFLHGCFLSPVMAVLPLPRAQLPAVLVRASTRQVGGGHREGLHL